MNDSLIQHDRTSLLAQVAEMYYIDGMDQTAIAEIVGVTRSMVSRMLTDARNRGIVEIRIHHPLHAEHNLEQQLKQLTGIRDVFVVSVRSHDDHSRLLAELGHAAASVFQRFVEPGKSIGIAWGTTVSAVINALEVNTSLPVKVIQLIGALGARNQEYDGHALVLRLANKLGGEGYFINAPYLCQTPEIARAFMDAPGIRETIDLGKQVDVALLGIGTTELQFSSYFLAGYVDEQEIARLQSEGAVGDIAGNHFDLDGNIIKDGFTSRQITISSDALMQIPTRISVAGGPGKTNAVIGALRSGLVNVLVTDSITARNILASIQGINPLEV
jgi:DNA-binding transcriptional regulator LsrR (DeoR family)